MSAKCRDRNGRWRCRTIAFRCSEEENREINEIVKLSGMTKQDYILSKLLNKNVIVRGNPRVFKALRGSFEDIYKELIRITSVGEMSERLMETINLVTTIYKATLENDERNN